MRLIEINNFIHRMEFLKLESLYKFQASDFVTN